MICLDSQRKRTWLFLLPRELVDSFTKSKKDAHPDCVTGGEMGHGRTEQTESQEAEDAVRSHNRKAGCKCVCKESSEIPLTCNVL